MMLAIWIFGLAWALILYTYIGFPVLLALIARLVRQGAIPLNQSASAPLLSGRETVSNPESETPVRDSSNGMEGMPRVAMVVAAHNEEAVIAGKLANTWAIDYPSDRFEIWIGSDGSDDGTHELLQRCADPRLNVRLFGGRRGKISVLNDLIAEIDADVIVMSDANTVYETDAIQKLVRYFKDPGVGCVSGELGLTQDGGVSGEGLYWRYEGWIKRNESRLGFLIGCNGGIFAMRRACYRPLPPSTIVEDFVMTMRVLEQGYRVLFAPEARAWEPACGSSRSEMVRKIRIGAGGFQALGLTWRLLLPGFGLKAFAFWGHKVLRWLVPFFFLAALVAAIALWRVPAFDVVLGLQCAGCGIALLAYRAPTGSRLPRWTRPVSYFYLMNYSLLCGFIRFLCRTQRVTWDRQPARAATTPAPSRAAATPYNEEGPASPVEQYSCLCGRTDP